MLYNITEIFYSLQGEGRNTGMAAWFIRFAGCNLSCSFCDTDYSPKLNLGESHIIDLISMEKENCKNVILTGGEPSLQNLKPILLELKKQGFYVAIETNGTNDLLRYRREGLLDWVTVSPKVLPIKVDCIIDEIKVVWPSPILKQCEAIEARYHYLQPCDDKNKESNTKEVIDIVKQNSIWRLSLQTQKILQFK